MKITIVSPLLLLSLAASASALTFTVNNTTDPGDGVCDANGCTLREAITAANSSPGADSIVFHIPGAGVKTITPTSALPTITEAVAIDGYTQPGASVNTLAVGDNAVLLIELSGTSAGGQIGLNMTAANISTRGFVETGDNVMIGGIIVGPDDAADGSVLIRAIGPSLVDLGIPSALADPMLELHDGNGTLIASNNDWKSTQQAAIEATGVPPTDDRESALLATLASGNYTAIVLGVGGATGVGLVEAYHLD